MPYQARKTEIGQRRDRVRFLEPVSTDDGMGGQSVTRYRTVVTTWMEMTALDERSKEALAAQQLTARHAYHGNMRYRADVFASAEQWRLSWRNRTLEIHSVTDDDGRKQRLIILCAEVQ